MTRPFDGKDKLYKSALPLFELSAIYLFPFALKKKEEGISTRFGGTLFVNVHGWASMKTLQQYPCLCFEENGSQFNLSTEVLPSYRCTLS